MGAWGCFAAKNSPTPASSFSPHRLQHAQPAVGCIMPRDNKSVVVADTDSWPASASCFASLTPCLCVWLC